MFELYFIKKYKFEILIKSSKGFLIFKTQQKKIFKGLSNMWYRTHVKKYLINIENYKNKQITLFILKDLFIFLKDNIVLV